MGKLNYYIWKENNESHSFVLLSITVSMETAILFLNLLKKQIDAETKQTKVLITEFCFISFFVLYKSENKQQCLRLYVGPLSYET